MITVEDVERVADEMNFIHALEIVNEMAVEDAVFEETGLETEVTDLGICDAHIEWEYEE